MIKKTYVRVITLLLVALMILGGMAPAVTSYAASSLSVINNSPSVVNVTGTPQADKLSTGTHYFRIVGSDMKLYVSSSSSSQGEDTNVDCKDKNSVTYAGMNFG